MQSIFFGVNFYVVFNPLHKFAWVVFEFLCRILVEIFFEVMLEWFDYHFVFHARRHLVGFCIEVVFKYFRGYVAQILVAESFKNGYHAAFVVGMPLYELGYCFVVAARFHKKLCTVFRYCCGLFASKESCGVGFSYRIFIGKSCLVLFPHLLAYERQLRILRRRNDGHGIFLVCLSLANVGSFGVEIHGYVLVFTERHFTVAVFPVF